MKQPIYTMYRGAGFEFEPRKLFPHIPCVTKEAIVVTTPDDPHGIYLTNVGLVTAEVLGMTEATISFYYKLDHEGDADNCFQWLCKTFYTGSHTDVFRVGYDDTDSYHQPCDPEMVVRFCEAIHKIPLSREAMYQFVYWKMKDFYITGTPEWYHRWNLMRDEGEAIFKQYDLYLPYSEWNK